MAADDVFRLVQSMSKNEKRAFNLFLRKENRDSAFLKLFKQLSHQKEYDEEQLQSAFEGTSYFKHFSVLKTNLKKEILRCLRHYYESRKSYQEVLELLKDANILMDKRLYDMAFKRLRKAEKIGKRMHHDGLLLEIQLQKRQLFRVHQIGNYEKSIAEWREDNQRQVEKVQRLVEAMTTYEDAMTAYRKVGFSEAARERLKSLAEGFPRTVENDVAYYNVAVAVYSFWQIYYSSQKEYAAALESLYDLARIIEANPSLLQEKIGVYLATLSNIISYEAALENWDETARVLEKLKKLEVSDHRQESRQFILICQSTLIKAILRGRFEEPLDYEQKFLDRLHSNDFSPTHRHLVLAVKQNFAIVHFFLGAYGKAQFYLDDIFNNPMEIQKDIHHFCRLLGALIYLEQGLDTLVEREAKSLKRQFSDEKKHFIYITSQMLPRVAFALEEEKQALFQELEEKLEAVRTENFRVNGYFIIRRWVTQQANRLTE